METTRPRYVWLNIALVLLIMPAAWVLGTSVLKYGLGIDGPFDMMAPWFEKIGIRESIGWNINLLIVVGPVIALLVSLLQILGIDWQFSKEQLQVRITILRKRFPLFLCIFSGLILATLIVYLVGENF